MVCSVIKTSVRVSRDGEYQTWTLSSLMADEVKSHCLINLYV